LLNRVLVANRGEVAIRIIRACRELGVATVAVYSDADAMAPHVLAADESVHIGTAPASHSYLVGERIIAAALQTGCDSVHPGYGFLSERAWFAEAVSSAGLAFVGPSPSAIALMGNKTSARALAVREGVPVVPGSAPLSDAAAAAGEAEKMGFPLLLKAATGGGGRGMRLVRSSAELTASFDSARRESQAAFGDDSIYMEKHIERPRHIEIQILADQFGNLLHLGERECSVQRRHQKMIEEAPSIVVDAGLRSAMGAMAVRLARAGSYVNAGTCEFLLDAGRNFYFLEMNTRLQVEHPVTELVTGVDLVHWQLRIAAGEALDIQQEDVAPRGWAIECRITSESAAAGLLPSTGRIVSLQLPGGPGVRWDGGVEVGTDVTAYYDPMLAKLIVWAATRDLAVERMLRALSELQIAGVETSREFHLRLLSDPDFRAGAIDVQWLERNFDRIMSRDPNAPLAEIAAIAAALQDSVQQLAPDGGAAHGGDPAYASRAHAAGWPRQQWRDPGTRRNA
jgi:acetyl-CoA carboxylase biotin carboxylase subunit